MKRIVLAGGSGFLGRALSRHFTAPNFEAVILTRAPRGARNNVAREVFWDARNLGAWTTELDGADAVIHLTGRSVDCRYNTKNRREIMRSRVESTRVIGQAIAQCQQAPRVWLNASTATIYKHTFGPAWDESGMSEATPEVRDEFSIEVARAWEDELNRAQTPETRKTALRTAMVLGGAKNSVFPVLRRLVRFGLGGRHATGRQFVSWIHERDFCRAVEWLINHETLSGVVNLCAPNPLPNAEMMQILREVIGVPFGLPASSWMLEIGAFFLRTETELMIKSRRVFPRRLLDSGFHFEFPTFQAAVSNLAHSHSYS